MMTRNDYEQRFEEKKQAMIQQREEWTKKLIEENLKFHPQASRDVLEFIANILYHGVPEIELKDSADNSIEVRREVHRLLACTETAEGYPLFAKDIIDTYSVKRGTLLEEINKGMLLKDWWLKCRVY